MGSDESHFNVSLIVRDKVTRQCPQTRTFEEKGEPKRIRTEVLLAYQPNALPLGQTGSHRLGLSTRTLSTARIVSLYIQSSSSPCTQHNFTRRPLYVRNIITQLVLCTQHNYTTRPLHVLKTRYKKLVTHTESNASAVRAENSAI